MVEKAIVASSLGSVAFHIQVLDLSHILVKKKTMQFIQNLKDQHTSNATVFRSSF